MAWLETLHCGEDRKAFDDGHISVQQFGEMMSIKIKELRQFKDNYELEEMADRFEEVGNVDEFDDVLQELYDYGDDEYNLFVNMWR